jgi:MoaA/NifB/PqqE/SkfB family radical SAM enzyme
MAYISPTKVFQHVDRLARWKSGEKAAPVTVEWDLSNRCYLGCEACHFAHTHTKGPWAAVKDRKLPMAWEGTGDLADTGLVLRGLSEMASSGVRGVVWSGGGEPTTHPNWQPIVEHAANAGLHQGMYTAGGLLNFESAKFLSERASWVVVSLDTLDDKTYAKEKRVKPELFYRACDGIQHLIGRKAVIGVSFLLHENNWPDAPAMRRLALGLGASYVTFRPRIDTQPDNPAVITSNREWVTDAIPMLRLEAEHPQVECSPERFEQYRDWTGHGYKECHGIKFNTTVTPDGRVWVCLQRRGVQGSCIGDLTKMSFDEVWLQHPGVWTDFTECRAMCRLHLVNQQVAEVFSSHPHAAFV